MPKTENGGGSSWLRLWFHHNDYGCRLCSSLRHVRDDVDDDDDHDKQKSKELSNLQSKQR